MDCDILECTFHSLFSDLPKEDIAGRHDFSPYQINLDTEKRRAIFIG